MEKVVKCEIKPGLPLIVPDNVYRMDSKTKITSFMRNKQIIDIKSHMAVNSNINFIFISENL